MNGKEKRKAYQREFARKNRECGKAKLSIRRLRLRKKVWILQELGHDCCENCGYWKNYSALEIHHEKPETKDFEGTITALTWKKLKETVTKNKEYLRVLCSNCHKEKHYPELQRNEK